MPLSDTPKSREELEAQIEELSRRLEETEQILEAIQSGSVDAVVVATPEGSQIFTLQGAEHPYRVLVETMSEGAITMGSDGSILYCNTRFAAMLQYPMEKIIGSPLASYVAPADVPFFNARIRKCREEFSKHEISLVTHSGAPLPVLVSCCSMGPSEAGAVSVIVTDITQRKQTERTILRLNRLYAMLSGTNHAIVHAASPASIYHEFCRVAVEAGGFRLACVGLIDEASGAVKTAAACGETGYLDGLESGAGTDADGMRPVNLAISEGTYYICNDFLADETTRPWRIKAHAHGLYAVASVVIKQDEDVIGALTLYADEKNFFDAQQVDLLQQMSTEVSFALETLHQSVLRKEAEQALQSETVERLRAVEELRNNEQMLIHQSRHAALGEMIGNIAHQWRQPLNSLGLLVQQAPLYYALGEVDQEYMEQSAKKAMELIQHMSRTIDDFRNFFKPNKTKVLFHVKDEVVRTISLLAGSLEGQRIAVEVETDADPVVEGYPNEFSQALLNILINARDALMERHVAAPKVIIKVTSENSRAVTTIVDNAGGIPEEVIGKIFDPYFTTKGPQAGTGVGLFMSKTIIEKNMGGSVTVRNTGAGAEFRIEV
ncbi:PAS domain-containing sensor histidine kinase [Geomonas propionica]|uniref:histidine kinase n=1 Tax=Geomonas propionica TaxID=2798582 RepID=A0ABS0YMR0_9BACT|nr:ATP-binding protein [Geomonas propionica]MBJ6798785.1 GAF domain-containing protein [Geomonas propionica]